jgi:hypothetical protein
MTPMGAPFGVGPPVQLPSPISGSLLGYDDSNLLTTIG